LVSVTGLARPASMRRVIVSDEKPWANMSTSSLIPRGAPASVLRARRCSRLRRGCRGDGANRGPFMD
jgi:hypothetical protein